MGSKLSSLIHPKLERAKEDIEQALNRERMILLFGPCRVSYDGRAASDLGTGDRFLMIKPDGVVAVHSDENVKPKNWQPTGSSCRVHYIAGSDILKIVSERSSPNEKLEVVFPNIYHLSTYDITDSKELDLSGTEEQMQQRIMDNPEIIEDGFRAVEAEKKISVGSIDIFGYDSQNRPVILELKRRRIGPEAVDQLRRYVEVYSTEVSDDVRGILVAPSVTESAENFLSKAGLEYISLKPKLGNQDINQTTKLTDFEKD